MTPRRAFALGLLSLTSLAPAALADTVYLSSRVDAVTVFPDAASIHRVGRARVQAGEHQLVFTALPSELTDDTVRVGGFGPAATVEAVTVRPGRLAEVTGGEIQRVEAQLVATQRQRDALRQQRSRGAAQAAQADRALAETEARITQLAATLTRMRVEGERAVKFVTIDVTTARDGELEVSVEYLVPTAASWRPTYAAHLDASRGIVGIDVFASVQQRTGEDWTGVRLTVSTVRPASGLALPTLEEHAIELEPQEEPEVELSLQMRRAMSRRPMPTTAGAGRGMGADMDVPASAPEPASPPPAPLEQRTMVQRARLLSARIEVPTPVTVRSGATPRRLLASHIESEAVIEHQTAPRVSSAVFLAARVRNAAGFPLLAGPVALFVGSDYVGTTQGRDVPVGEELLLPFGVDSTVTVDRTLAARAAAQRGGREETTLRYQFRLSNHGERQVRVTVLDQLPVSRTAGLSVRVLPGGPARAAHHEGDAPGVVRWNMELAPNGTQRWEHGYVVSAPRRRVINGEVE